MKTMKKQFTKIFITAFLMTILTAGYVNAAVTEADDVSGLENVVEPKMELESWMVSENYWDNNVDTYFFTLEKDNSLALENWMLDESIWMNERIENQMIGSEREMVLENWMIDEIYWN